MTIRIRERALLSMLLLLALPGCGGSTAENPDSGTDVVTPLDVPQDTMAVDSPGPRDTPADRFVLEVAPDAPSRDAGTDVANDTAFDAPSDTAIDTPMDTAIDAANDTVIDTPAPLVYCGHPADCAAGTTCAPDGTCQSGDCAVTGCIYGFACGANGACASPNANACDDDTQCASGSLCINALCVLAENLCVDQTQCANVAKCLEGRCVLACRSNADCRDGFQCDTTLGTCSIPAQRCTITNDCGGPSEVCVAGACAPRSNGASCATQGDVWFDNGCVPTGAIAAVCNNTGVQDACAAGSICVDHSCYIACTPSTGAPCNQLTVLNQCKPFDTASGTYNVCATASNLGRECDLTRGVRCSGTSVCLDGFCK